MTSDGLFPKPDSAPTSAVSPLDVEQSFSDAGSFEVRDEFQDLVERDLLGPWDGDAEKFRPRAMGPRERYLVGMLGPKRAPRSTMDDADATTDTESGVQGDARGEEGGELPDILTPQNLGRIWASSMGLSFCVGADTDVVVVTASWGRYFKHESEDAEGRKRSVWAREPMEFQPELRLDGERDFRVPLSVVDPSDPGVSLAVAVRPAGSTRTIEVTLINAQEEPESNRDAAWIFQTKLTVTALDSTAPIFVPIDDPMADANPVVEDQEELHLRLLYRDQMKFATGQNVAVHAHTELAIRRAHKLETRWLPTHDVAGHHRAGRRGHGTGQRGAVDGRTRDGRAGGVAHGALTAGGWVRRLARQAQAEDCRIARSAARSGRGCGVQGTNRAPTHQRGHQAAHRPGITTPQGGVAGVPVR